MESKYLVPGVIGAGALSAYALDKTGTVNLFGEAGKTQLGKGEALGVCKQISVVGEANYQVTDISFSKTEPDVGEQFQVTATYTNNGEIAESTGEGMVLISDKLGQLGKAPINYIEPGATDTVTFTVTINQAGSFSLCADIRPITLQG